MEYLIIGLVFILIIGGVIDFIENINDYLG